MNYHYISEVDEDLVIQKNKSSRGFQTVSNILLFIIFIGLGVIVFNVVKSYNCEMILDKTESQSLSYSQDYTKNPNYIKESAWELIKVDTDHNLNSIAFIDDYRGFIAGDSGLAMQSLDGGNVVEKT